MQKRSPIPPSYLLILQWVVWTIFILMGVLLLAGAMHLGT